MKSQMGGCIIFVYFILIAGRVSTHNETRRGKELYNISSAASQGDCGILGATLEDEV